MSGRVACVVAAACIGLGACVTPVRADVISVNFVGGQSGTTAPDVTKGGANVTGMAGAVPANSWNNEGPSQHATSVSIVNAAGAPAASIAYSAPDDWAASAKSPIGGTNAALMSGYLDNFQNSGSIVVTGLGPAFTSGGYQVLVYQNSDSNGSFGYTVTDNAGHTVTAYGLQTGGAGGNYPLAGGPNGFVGSTSTNPAGPGSAANYVILSGLTGSSFTIQGMTGTTGDGRVRPNGFQIVSANSSAPIFTVTTIIDHDDGVCNAADCTLREAVNAANAVSGGAVIQFASNVGTITLNSTPLPTITAHTVIEGGGAVTISGANTSFIFSVTAGATLTLNNLTITKGFNSSGDGGAIRNGTANGNGGTLIVTNCKFLENKTGASWSGGAILSYGPLTATNCEFGSNQAGNGGAIYPRFAPAVTTITGCSFHDNSTLNTTNGWGGAILLWDGAPVTVTNSQFFNNMASSGDFSSSTIDRGGAIYVTFNSTLTVDNSQFYNNSAFFGGALYVDASGNLTLTNSELHDNTIGVFDGTQGGGAIYNAGTLVVDTDQLHDNHADGAGGAIYNVSPGTITVTNSVLRHNSAGGGGAIATASNASVTTSTLADNIAQSYGGAVQDGDETDTTKAMTITASTLSGNSAGLHGGAIESEMKLTLTNVTISGNSGPELLDHYERLLTLTNVTIAQNTGVGLSLQSGASLTMTNTLLASNSSGNCSSLLPSSGFNLADDTTCGLTNTGDHQGPSFNPKLGILQNNGGQTQTLMPAPGSPAIDNGTGVNAPSTDQRGTKRPQGAAVDIGAVEVGPTDLPTLANIATRLAVQTGDNVLFAGFIITGTQPKKVIIRALGPSVQAPGVLANPTLELHGPDGSGHDVLLASNDDWQNQPAADRQAVIDSTIPPPNDLESALVRTLPANNSAYTAVVRGVNNSTGIGVVEVYDLDRSVDSKLANISTRGLVQTQDNVLIAGLTVLGQSPQKVIVRAIGPSLNVDGKLADPTLELHDGNGNLMEANDNWVDSPNKQAIIDSTVAPTNDLESAIVRILTGSGSQYTAIVRGVNNTTGIGVVEVYALP